MRLYVLRMGRIRVERVGGIWYFGDAETPFSPLDGGPGVLNTWLLTIGQSDRGELDFGGDEGLRLDFEQEFGSVSSPIVAEG